MAQTTYFSILGVSYSGAVLGRSLCLTLDANGHFTAELGEYRLDSGFEPCGRVSRCTMTGELRPRGSSWSVIEQQYSCPLRRKPPVEYRGRLSLSGKILVLRFEGGGLFGPLTSFGMHPGPCTKRPNGYPACRGSAQSPSLFDHGGY